jgi:hypothetical protein
VVGLKRKKAKAKKKVTKKEKETMEAAMKEMEKALFSIRFYPVAVNADAKDEAIQKLIKTYNSGSETVRQLLLYMIHENMAESVNLRIMHTYEYFKLKNPTLDSAQLRMNVYRTMFNYNTSMEGIMELIELLGMLKGSDDAAKLLTYHFSFLSTHENESTHMLRAAILEALGNSDSRYALDALLEYAKYTDNDRTFQRIVSALVQWEDKLEEIVKDPEERETLRAKVRDVTTREFSGRHYG